MLVYDVTNNESFTALAEWYDMVKKANGNKSLRGKSPSKLQLSM
jgi:hypothetical protein